MKWFELVRRNSSPPSPWLRATLLCTVLLALEGHVTIAPGEVVAGSSQRFTLRVPSERPAATIEIRLEFPAGLGAPRFLSKPGWKYELEKDAAGKVTAVTWKGGEIGPDEFDEFVFTTKAPATPGTIFFKARQTYQGGEVVEWTSQEGEEGPAPRVVVRDSTEIAAVTAPAAGSKGWMSAAALGLSVVALSLALRRRG